MNYLLNVGPDPLGRIRLEKGRNRILVRIENGWMGLCWSLCISLEDGKISL